MHIPEITWITTYICKFWNPPAGIKHGTLILSYKLDSMHAELTSELHNYIVWAELHILMMASGKRFSYIQLEGHGSSWFI